MCAISINSYDWDSSESEGKRPMQTPYRICGSAYLHSFKKIVNKKIFPTMSLFDSSKTDFGHEYVKAIA